MKIECPHCQKAYNIPDERFPAGKKKIAFSCPACKGTIQIDLTSMTHHHTSEQVEGGEEDAQQDSEKLKKRIIRAMSDLPPMPQVVMKAQEVMADPGSSFRELGKVIETDQAIAARVLKLANSAYYGLRGMVSSIHQASIVLGYETLGELITVVGAAGLLDSIMKGYGLESGFLWQHSLAVAFGSRLIAKKKFPPLENDAFSAGLLHDAGKIVLDDYVFERETDFDRFMGNDKNTFLAAEKEILGFDHAEIAYELCAKWSIPETQGIGIRYHHYPSLSDNSELAYILHVADTMAMRKGVGAGRDALLYEI